ncbi:MAG: site-specific integrase [Candidatus Shapirobacteria bacterium]|nr:site-specific integrase [Candidatus Shapirobacteria bacterium]
MNFKNITQPFSLYLKSERVSENTLRNYLLDSQHFLAWLANNYPDLASDNPNIIAQNISLVVLNNYKDFLKNNHTAPSTVNRRLSSLRKLSEFFVSQGWRQNNPGKKVANITNKKDTGDYWQILNRFAKSLKTEEKSSSTIRNYLSDVRGYLYFINKKLTNN